MLYINATPGEKLSLGYEGENLARTIRFDIGRWQRLYGPGIVTLLHQRGNEQTPYPCVITQNGSTVEWPITSVETAVASKYGCYEMQYRVGEQLVKSVTAGTRVADALGTPTETPPEPQQGWVDQVLQAGADALAGAARAEEAAIRQPYPNADTGTWWIWDAELGRYVDSGETYRGEDSGSIADAVLCTKQTLTDEQKTRARTNIGAASSEEVSQLSEEKVNIDQGAANSGKFLGIGADGKVVPVDVSSDKPIEITATNIISNGSFNDGSASWNSVAGSVLSVIDGKASCSNDGTTTIVGITQTIPKNTFPQRTGDIWFAKMRATVEKYTVPGSAAMVYPGVELYTNITQGLMYWHNALAKADVADYYGNIEITAEAQSAFILFARVQYNKTEYVTGRTCTFDNVVLVNLTDAYGAGNEPTADEFYQLLQTQDGAWFDGTHTFGQEEQEEKSFMEKLAAVKDDLTVTVGTGGDYETLNEALAYLSERRTAFKNGGVNYEIQIRDGTIITEQIWVERNDLSYISITTDNADNTVQVDVTGWTGVTHDTRGNRPFFSAEYGARLPCIKCLFSCIIPDGGWTSENQAVGYFCNRGSTGVIAGSVDTSDVRANVGFENFYDNIIANNNSEIVLREAIARNAGRYGVLSRHISRVSARSADITNCADIAAYADRASMMDVRRADLSGSKNAIAAYHASTITANETVADNIETLVADSKYGSVVNCQGIVCDTVSNVFAVSGGATIVATGAVVTNEAGTEYSQNVNTLTANGVIYA